MSQSVLHSPSQSASTPQQRTLPPGVHLPLAQDQSISKVSAAAPLVPQQTVACSPVQTQLPPSSPSWSLIHSPKTLSQTFSPPANSSAKAKHKYMKHPPSLFFRCRIKPSSRRKLPAGERSVRT